VVAAGVPSSAALVESPRDQLKLRVSPLGSLRLRSASVVRPGDLQTNGPPVQELWHSPPTGGSDVWHVSQSVALGPEHVAHEESHAAHSRSATVVQAALSNSPASHVVVQLWHEVLPAAAAKVPPAHVRQLLLAGSGW
jgi:hypothetical protein